MKLLVLSCLLLWARHGEGGAIKCLPGDDECTAQLTQEVEKQELELQRPSVPAALAECLSGSEWESNCHRCRCVAGVAQCLRLTGCDSIGEPIRCKPNTTYEQDCNACSCLENGLSICTLVECISAITEAPAPKPVIPKGVDCAPGTTWQSRCNDCVCSPDGRTHCTEEACPGQETEPVQRCAPQSQWKNDCNMCWCTSGRAMCTKMGCLAIPSDMHFDDRKGETRPEEIPELGLTELPDIKSNDIFESDAKVQKHLSENLEDLDKTTDIVDENVNETNLKELEDFDHNDIDTPIQVPDQVLTDFAANTESNVLDKDLELLETLNRVTQETDESSDDVKGIKDVEILDDAYINQHSKTAHRVKKRSTCKPNQEFLNDCNICKCAESGQSYACTQNECMDRDDGTGGQGGEEGDKGVDKEVEVFMESEGKDHVEKHSVCKASTTFYVGCNQCHCNADGTDFSCANKPCPLPADVEVFHELHEMKPIVPYTGEKTKDKPSK